MKDSVTIVLETDLFCSYAREPLNYKHNKFHSDTLVSVPHLHILMKAVTLRDNSHIC